MISLTSVISELKVDFACCEEQTCSAELKEFLSSSSIVGEPGEKSHEA